MSVTHSTTKTYTYRNWNPLYVWFASTIALLWGVYYAYIMNVYTFIYNADVTHITQVIATVVSIAVLRIGWLNYLWSKKEYYEDTKTATEVGRRHIWDDDLVARIRKHFHEWWYASNILVYLGLIGTLIGFSMTFGILMDAAKSNPAGLTSQVVLSIIPNLIKPIGTVFFPTICGLIGLVIIQVQLKLFESFSGMDDDQYEVQANDKNNQA